MSYQLAPFPMTLSDVQLTYLLQAFQMRFFVGLCSAVDKLSVVTGVARSLCLLPYLDVCQCRVSNLKSSQSRLIDFICFIDYCV